MGRRLLVLESLADDAVGPAAPAGAREAASWGSAAAGPRRCDVGPGGPAVAGGSGAAGRRAGVSGSCRGG